MSSCVFAAAWRAELLCVVLSGEALNAGITLKPLQIHNQLVVLGTEYFDLRFKSKTCRLSYFPLAFVNTHPLFFLFLICEIFPFPLGCVEQLKGSVCGI